MCGQKIEFFLCGAKLNCIKDTIYIDDGYSGMDFQRPEFERMMEDISLKRVNCIIVKDLSRFGRDYIETGRWIQRIFPALGVRFIAVADRYDSKTAADSETSFLLPIKNFINDSYCRDISQKVRSCQRVKWEKGEFIGAFSIYGYRKSEKDPHRLEKDSYAAEIVKKIYQWKLAGWSMLAIADQLNQKGILSPMEYKRLNKENYFTGFGLEGCAKWSAASVKRILENETYTGTLVQGKKERISYKVKQSISKKKEEWIRCFDCHEAIVTKTEYDMVQRLLCMPVRMKKDTNKIYPFTGLLFCADCKKPLIRRVNRYKGRERVFYICSTKNKGLGCSRHSIAEDILEEQVNQAVKQILKVEKQQKTTESVWQTDQKEREKILEEELEKLKIYKESYQKLYASLEESQANGVLTKEEADSFFQIWKRQEKGIEEAIIKQENSKIEEDFTELIERKQTFFIIKRIEVEEGGSFCIILNNGEEYRA